MSHSAGDEPLRDRLSCGADVDELLDQVASGRGNERDAHQAGCPFCQASLAEYDRLWAPVREVADTKVVAPDSVLAEAIRRIRGTVADPEYGTLSGPTGATRVSARVVVVTARQSAQDIAGVRVALSKLITVATTPTDDDPAPHQPSAQDRPTDHISGTEDRPRPSGARVVAGVAGRSTAIEVTLAADYGTDLVALGERIRAHVTARVRDLTGLEPVTVTVHIDDVFT